ncbi:MAG TPA: hypothetical protein VN829_19060 [Dongiaceae bacterium]|nr:hypothetical protein [Dongiaceae bacterium]
MGPPPEQPPRCFEFERDTFTFANELVWHYRFDPASGAMTVSRSVPGPAYFHRCFVVVRSARQFFYHARFEPGLPAAEAAVYRRLIRQVVSRNPRRMSAGRKRIVIPGYECLRAFSRAQEPLLKAECGGPWQSYFLRSHWRMVFPVWGRHQERMARQLQQAVRQGAAPTVHLFRFPRITINHGLMLFGVAESGRDLEFEAYDPNIPAHPARLIYDPGRRAFRFPPSCYWAGGVVSVIEIFRGGLY